MMKPRVLVIDDEVAKSDVEQEYLKRSFDPDGRCEFAFCSGQVEGKNSMSKVREEVAKGWPHEASRTNWALVLLDIAFFQEQTTPDDQNWGLEVLQALREQSSDLPIVMLTTEKDLKKKKEASNWRQADGFLPKPTKDSTNSPRAFLHALYSYGFFPDLREEHRLAGESMAWLKVLQEARRFACAPLGSSRLLYGETGTGKTELARLIHDEMGLLAGRTGPFKVWSAAGANEDITKAAIFGHWPGAYTDATPAQAGLIEMAHGGTFFLDEVASLGAGAQALFIESRRRVKAKDGRFLRLISRMGKFPSKGQRLRQGQPDPWKQAIDSIEPKPWEQHLQDDRISVDVVILYATNINLHDDAVLEQVGFRRDLLNDLGAPIFIPGLNDRRDDIPAIFKQLVDERAANLGLPPKEVDPRVNEELQGRDWSKKNIVTLQQIAEHAVLEARDFDEILVRHLPSTGAHGGWAGDRPPKPETHVRLVGGHSTVSGPGAAPVVAAPQLGRIADVVEALGEFPGPGELTDLEGGLPRLQDAYARLVLRLFAAALRATRDRRGESSTLRAVCKLLGVAKLNGRPESYAAYDVLLRMVSLADVNFVGPQALPIEKCPLLSDDADVKERVQQAITQRRRPKEAAP